MFFDVIHAPMITAKQLKFRDPSEGLTPMPKLVLREKYVLRIKYLVFSLYLEYGSIYRQRGGVKPELGFHRVFSLSLV